MKQEQTLYAFRRHLKRCQFFGPGGRDAPSNKCNCPFHVEGVHRGVRPRKSLKTRNRQIAERRLSELIREIDARLDEEERNPRASATPKLSSAAPTIVYASDRFLLQYGAIGEDGKYRGNSPFSTYRKYRSSLRFLISFCDQSGRPLLADITVEVLEDFRRSRTIGKVTGKTELQTLRAFLSYCVSRKWLASNPAKEIRGPKNLAPNDVVPYTPSEERLILSACDQIGGGKYNRSGARYEQLRARAMILLLRHTALRVSDVSTFRKDAVSWDAEVATWRLLVRTQKTGEPVYLPIPDGLKQLLDALPPPRGAAQDCPYYFWNGVTSRRAVIGIAERTLSAVFRKSGVKNAHAHRYRHTLATSLLGDGASFHTVADILGNTEAIVRKHYGKWSKGRQENIDRLMMTHFQRAGITNPVTNQSHEKMEAVN